MKRNWWNELSDHERNLIFDMVDIIIDVFKTFDDGELEFEVKTKDGYIFSIRKNEDYYGHRDNFS